MPPLPGAAMRTMRTVVQFLSSVSCVAQLTHCSAPINIAAALSCLLTSVATVTAKFLFSKSKSEFNIKSEVERNNIKFEVQVSSSSTGKEV